MLLELQHPTHPGYAFRRCQGCVWTTLSHLMGIFVRARSFVRQGMKEKCVTLQYGIPESEGTSLKDGHCPRPVLEGSEDKTRKGMDITSSVEESVDGLWWRVKQEIMESLWKGRLVSRFVPKS